MCVHCTYPRKFGDHVNRITRMNIKNDIRYVLLTRYIHAYIYTQSSLRTRLFASLPARQYCRYNRQYTNIAQMQLFLKTTMV